MAEKAMSSNRHPVDLYVDVCGQIKELEQRKEALKTLIIGMLGDRDAVGGDEFIATCALQARSSLDKKALEKAVGADVIAACTKPGEPFYVIRTQPRVSEAA